MYDKSRQAPDPKPKTAYMSFQENCFDINTHGTEDQFNIYNTSEIKAINDKTTIEIRHTTYSVTHR